MITECFKMHILFRNKNEQEPGKKTQKVYLIPLDLPCLHPHNWPMKERFLSQRDFSLHPFVRVHAGFKALVNFYLFIRPSVFQTSSLVLSMLTFFTWATPLIHGSHNARNFAVLWYLKPVSFTHNQFSSQLPQVTLGVVFYLEVFFNLKLIRYCS